MATTTKYALCTECNEGYPIDDSGDEGCQMCGGKLMFLSPCCEVQFKRRHATHCPRCRKRVRGVTAE